MLAWSRTFRFASLAPAVCALFLASQLTACAPGNQPTAADRQNKAINDPFGYSPDLKKSDMTVSGHTDFDKQELKRDVDHVINP